MATYITMLGTRCNIELAFFSFTIRWIALITNPVLNSANPTISLQICSLECSSSAGLLVWYET